jgi:hypothetical protein
VLAQEPGVVTSVKVKVIELPTQSGSSTVGVGNTGTAGQLIGEGAVQTGARARTVGHASSARSTVSFTVNFVPIASVTVRVAT